MELFPPEILPNVKKHSKKDINIINIPIAIYLKKLHLFIFSLVPFNEFIISVLKNISIYNKKNLHCKNTIPKNDIVFWLYNKCWGMKIKIFALQHVFIKKHCN